MSWVDVTTAVSTAGAAVIALALGLRAEQRSIRHEREQRRRDEYQQASNVAAWILVEQAKDGIWTEVAVKGSQTIVRDARFHIVIQNGSNEPIWNVHMIRSETLVQKDDGHLDPGGIEEIECTGPRETRKISIIPWDRPLNRTPVGICFRDNAKKEWFRDSSGYLHPGWSGADKDLWKPGRL